MFNPLCSEYLRFRAHVQIQLMAIKALLKQENDLLVLKGHSPALFIDIILHLTPPPSPRLFHQTLH